MSFESVSAPRPTRRSLRETSAPARAEAPSPRPAPRRAKSGGGRKRVAGTAFSFGVIGVVGLLAVGITAAPEAVAAANHVAESSTERDAGVDIGKIIASQAQKYTAPVTVEAAALDRSDYSAATVIAAAVPAASSSSPIEAYAVNVVPVQGGLTLAQARDLIADYVSTSDTAPLRKGEAVLDALYPGSSGPGDCGYGGAVDKLDNCVGFVTYFMNMYTSFHGYVIANGGEEAANMASALGRSTSSSPSVYSVGSDWSTSDGHTFVVLGIQGDQAIIGEAACGLTDGWPRARAVPISSLQGDTFVNVADLIQAEPRALSDVLR